MCGVAGVMMRGEASPNPAVLEALAGALAHRGPDGAATYNKGAVGLAHARLAIIDLAGGDQPLTEPGGAALVGNGEIYNYVELRAQIGEATFATHSDCEPPLILYRRDGLGFVDALRGMWALAIHDPSARRLILSRDPFGIKPLYYVERDDCFAFASEPQALIRAGLAVAELNPQARDELLELQFTTGADTIFRGIKRCLPGETLAVENGRIIDRRRRQALPEGGDRLNGLSEAEALTQIEAALADSIAHHRRSDVPYGLFLSGGIDSSLVLSFMADGPEPVLAYTVGFDGRDDGDERSAAAKIAAAHGARHEVISFSEADFWALLPAVAVAMDDPAADYACPPTFKLAAAAAKDVKVVLTGEGGDELFGGYGRYRSVMRPWWLGGRTLRARGSLDRVGLRRRAAEGWRDGVAAAEVTEARAGRTRLQAAQAVDCADWLPNDLLTKLDRCLMAHGLEGRTPFLDPVVADLAYRLPDRMKIQHRRGKHILRLLAEKRAPQTDPFGKKKGFTAPVGQWIAGVSAKLGPLLAEQPAVAELCRPDRVKRLCDKPDKHGAFAIWTLLFYVLWRRAHIERLPMTGGVFELLEDNRRG